MLLSNGGPISYSNAFYIEISSSIKGALFIGVHERDERDSIILRNVLQFLV